MIIRRLRVELVNGDLIKVLGLHDSDELALVLGEDPPPMARAMAPLRDHESHPDDDDDDWNAVAASAAQGLQKEGRRAQEEVCDAVEQSEDQARHSLSALIAEAMGDELPSEVQAAAHDLERRFEEAMAEGGDFVGPDSEEGRQRTPTRSS